MPSILRAVKLKALQAESLGHSVEIKQSPIDGNSHITKEYKCLGGLKPNFNFD